MAGASRNNWSLFGLDLTRVGKWLALGLNQLLYDSDSWFLKRYDLPINVHQDGREVMHRAYRSDQNFVDSTTQPTFWAVALPADAVLIKTLHLPAVSEENLGDAIALEASMSSPFAEDHTRTAWRVRSRGKGTIEVVLAITSQSAIEGARSGRREQGRYVNATSPEVWAIAGDGSPVPFTEFGDERRAEYQRAIFKAAGTLCAICFSFLLALTVWAGFINIRADSLQEMLQEVRTTAAAAARQRDMLELGRSRLSVIEAAVDARPNYHFWINHVAASAPDTVYFDRMIFDEKLVTVNGYSDNASAYLRMLTEDSAYSDVRALSAFSTDRNTGLERFSIEWRVADFPPADEADQNVPLGDESVGLGAELEEGM